MYYYKWEASSSSSVHPVTFCNLLPLCKHFHLYFHKSFLPHGYMRQIQRMWEIFHPAWQVQVYCDDSKKYDSKSIQAWVTKASILAGSARNLGFLCSSKASIKAALRHILLGYVELCCVKSYQHQLERHQLSALCPDSTHQPWMRYRCDFGCVWID